MTKPNLRVPFNKLTENIGTKENPKNLLTQAMDFYIANSTFNENDFEKNFAAAEGMLIEDDYNYVLKPHGDDQPDRKVPARLFNYGIIIPTLVNTILGEFRKRDKQGHILSKSPESFNRKKIAMVKYSREKLNQLFLTTLNDLGFPVETDRFPVDYPNDMKKFEEAWADDYIESNKTIYELLRAELDLDEQFAEGLYYILCTNSIFTYKYVYDNRAVHEIIHPNEIGFYASRNIKYLEDSEAVVRRKLMKVSEIISNFGDILSEKQIEKLQNGVSSSKFRNNMILQGLSAKTVSMQNSPYGPLSKIKIGQPLGETTISSGEEEHFVFHIEFTGYMEMGDIIVPDPVTGAQNQVLVTRDYFDHSKVSNWRYLPVNFEGTRIDDISIGVGILGKQRRKVNDPTNIKKRYNGMLFRGQSFVEGLMPFEHNINFALYKGMMTLGRSKGRLTFLPLSIIPEKEDLDMFDFLHFLETEGIGFIEDVDDNVLRALQYIKSIDLSFHEYLKFLMDYVDKIIMMAMRKVGFSDARIGDISPSTGKGVASMAQENSSTSMEDFILRYMKFLEKEGQGLIDYGQSAWQNGKQGMYKNNAGQQTYYEIDPNHTQEEMGFYFRFDPREEVKLRQMRELAFTFAQNSASPALIKEIVGADNMGEMSKALDKLERMSQQLQESQQRAQQAMVEVEQGKSQLENSLKDKDIMTRYQASLNTDQTKERIEMRKLYADMAEKLDDNGNVKDREGMTKLLNERMKTVMDFKIGSEKINVDREKIKSSEKIARINQETQLKNKVVGEK